MQAKSFDAREHVKQLLTTTDTYCEYGSTKKREYAQRVRHVVDRVFTPLVFQHKIGRWNLQEITKTLLGRHGVVSLSPIRCNPLLCHPMHLWKYLTLRSP